MVLSEKKNILPIDFPLNLSVTGNDVMTGGIVLLWALVEIIVTRLQ